LAQPTLSADSAPPSRKPLDVVVIRGHCTATGIRMAAEFAKAKTTTLVVWDRHHRGTAETKVAAALSKRVYTAAFEEEGPDKVVAQKASEFFGAGAPKCALVHLGSDKLKQAAKLERPLWQASELVKSIEENHTETVQSFHALSIYQSWLHSRRGCCFQVVPRSLRYEWDDDMATCTVS
ncbi:unnamed protein product, partial [Polarella glacialis]